MRKLVAYTVLGAAAAFAGPALAADPVKFDYPVYKDYVPPYIPEVDYGLKGSFYLRGSVGGNYSWAKEANHPDEGNTFEIIDGGWGYSAGVGAGYETGDGLRFDVTVDYLSNNGMTASVDDGLGDRTLELRSTLALANVYYDFGLDGSSLSAAGGMFGYVGAGIGAAFNDSRVSNDVGPGPWGGNTSLAAAGMAGVGYDFGALVADLGYRGVYINRIENTNEAPSYTVDHALIHEVRGTLRYRFN